jgi:APA family basic amino acid/polyamine antiporter
MTAQGSGSSRATLSVTDGALMMVGIVVGVGIFKSPQLVAAFSPNEWVFIALWVCGGLTTLIGALVYAELAAAYPSRGGEYNFLRRAFGFPIAFLFAWARTTVIQTGAIAAVAYVFGDYARQIVPLGSHGSAIYAAAALAALTLLNVSGTWHSKTAQNVLTLGFVATMLAVVVIGLMNLGTGAPVTSSGEGVGFGMIGLAMVFILVSYGGWNEAAYLSGDVRNAGRDMVRILIAGTTIVTLIYVLVNVGYLITLGLDGMRRSDAVVADVMRSALGPDGAVIVSAIVCVAALSTMNAIIFTGARLYHALGQDLALGQFRIRDPVRDNSRNAVLLQSAVAMVLVLVGAVAQSGFRAMVEYTAPVFWFFLLLVGLSLLVLRHRDPDRPRPFRVPLYPVTPAVFCLVCAYLIYSSFAYAGRGALFGIAVLLAGIPLLAVMHLTRRRATD